MLGAQQLFLPGLDPPPTDRLFFAVQPDAAGAGEALARAAALKGELGLKARPFPPARLHVTLHHLGDHAGLPRALVARAEAAAATLRQTPFEICFDRVGSFAASRRRLPLVLRGGGRVIPLIAFQHVLGEALARAGLGRWIKPGYTPHMTLLYDPRYVATRPVAPIVWTAREFVLVHSLLGRSRYVTLARWPLMEAE